MWTFKKEIFKTENIITNDCSFVVNAREITSCSTCSGDIEIGGQIWNRCNLDITKFFGGQEIKDGSNYTKEQWLREPQPAWCYYDNNPDNCEHYGRLYNWAASNPYSGILVEGYRVPTWADWTQLYEYLGGPSPGSLGNTGGMLKSTGTIQAGTGLWNYPNSQASNSSGFSATPGGYRYSGDGLFKNIGNAGLWWSSTMPAYYRQGFALSHLNGDISLPAINAGSAASIRLIKNER